MCLPDGICHSPECGQDVEDVSLLWVGRPGEENDHNDNVDECAKKENGHTPDVFDDEPKAEGADGITDSKYNQDVAQVVNAIRARDITLKRNITIIL